MIKLQSVQAFESSNKKPAHALRASSAAVPPQLAEPAGHLGPRGPVRNRWLIAVTGDSRSSLQAMFAVRSMAQERWLVAAVSGSARIIPNLLGVVRGSVNSFNASS